MLVKILEKNKWYAIFTWYGLSGLSDVIDAFIMSGKLGQLFLPLKDDFEIISVTCPRNKMIYVYTVWPRIL